MNRRVFAIGVLCALLTACELTTGPDWSSDGQGVSARAGSDAIVLRNRSGFTVHYFAVEEQTGTVLDLFFDPRAWPALEAGADARIPYAEIVGYHEDAERVVVYAWSEGQLRSFKVDL